MPAYRRSDFSGGWVADVDAINGPPNALPRFDNVVLDERGALSVRRGSADVFTAGPASSGGGELRVHSLFTTLMGNSVFRCAGIDDSVYINGARRQQGVDGGVNADIIFASGQGFVFWTRGTTHSKYDGSAVVSHGIAKPIQAPQVDIIPPDTLQICDFGPNEVWQGYIGEMERIEGQDGTPDGAIQITPSEDANQGQVQFNFPAEYDQTVYDDFQEGCDLDRVELYVGHQTPRQLVSIVLQINCNGDQKQFESDFFSYTFFPDFAVNQRLDPQSQKANNIPEQVLVTKIDQERVNEEMEGGKVFRYRSMTPTAGNPENAEAETQTIWSKLSVPRGAFDRIGNTPGKGWNTVDAVRIVVNVQKMDPSNTDETYGPMQFDDLRISGGKERTLTGKFRVMYRLRNQLTNYAAHSPLSDMSDEVELQNNGLSIGIPLAARQQFDAQADGIEIFLIGGSTNAVYRFYESGNPQSPNHTITMSELDAVRTNIKATRDGNTPPDRIVGMVTDHFFRMLILTEDGNLWVSERLDYDLYRSGRVINISRSATMKFIVKRGNEVVIGHSDDFVRLAGTGEEAPDGTIDFTPEPMGVEFPPTSEAVAIEDSTLIYLASDGPRQLGAKGSSVALRDRVSLLYQGYTRYEVPSLDLGLGPGRVRMGIYRGRLYMMAPESPNHSSTNIVHVRDLDGTWRRYVYPFTLLSLLREKNGDLLAGITNGVDPGAVIQLEIGDNDRGSQIPVEVWTVRDGDGKPLMRKEGFDFRADLDTGGSEAMFALYRDDDAAPTTVGLLTSSPESPDGVTQQSFNIQDLSDFKRVQLRITGNFNSFRLSEWALTYRLRPMARLYWDTGFLDMRASEAVWSRTITATLMAYYNVIVTPYFDGVEFPSFTIVIRPGVVFPYRIPVPRGFAGFQPRFVFRSSQTASILDLEKIGIPEDRKFELYRIEFGLRDTGQATSNVRRKFSFTGEESE